MNLPMVIETLKIARLQVRPHLGRTWSRRREAVGQDLGISSGTIGRITGLTFFICGALGLASLALPVGHNPHTVAAAIATSVAIACGIVAWLLPWNAWPRRCTHALIPLGFALTGVAIAFMGAYAYAFGAMFCVCFIAVGLAHRPGTAIVMLPLFIVAYVIPLLLTRHGLPLSLSLAAFVGVLCVVVAETVAWITARLQRSQAALLRAHTALNEISADLTSVDTEGVGRNTSARLGLLLGVPDVDIYSLCPDGGLTCLASAVDGRPPAELGAARSNLSSWKAGASAVVTRQPAVDPDRPGALAIPLVAGDRVVGLVDAADDRPERTIPPDRVTNALSVCRLIALSIQHAEARAAEQAQTLRLVSVLESSQAVTSADDLEGALGILTERAAEVIHASECVAYEYLRDVDAIVPRAMWEKQPTGWNRLGSVLPLTQHPVERQIMAAGAPLLETISDPDLDPVSRQIMTKWGEKSCLSIPMRSAEGPMGLLVFWDSAYERRYTGDEMALACGLADLAGEAVRKARLIQTLQRLSGTDSLTGLANHRQIHELLTREQARAERHGLTFILVMIDIDGFKLLNDTYGHPCGDAALQHIASILQANARASDVVGRYGGDEFILILPETDPEDAHAAIGEIRAAIRQKPFVTPTGERIPLHASFGIGAYPRDGRSVSDLVVAADVNLYISKRRGGDAITGSSEGVDPYSGEQTAFSILESMVAAVDNKDRYTCHHSEQVTEFALTLAAALGLSDDELHVIKAGGLLHDVGKIGIPDRILRKPGRLTEEEWAIVKGHPSMGEALIRTMPGLDEAQEAVAAHHEHFDGSGYPKGLRGLEIPLPARILAVADAYSAMISDRPYRKALSREEAIAELRKGAGADFDPDIVSTFIRTLNKPRALRKAAAAPAADLA